MGKHEILITKVNYVPLIQTTLISSRELTKKGWNVLFKKDIAIASHLKVDFNIKATWKHNAYYLKFLVDFKSLEKVVYYIDGIINQKDNLLDLYHKRLNH